MTAANISKFKVKKATVGSPATFNDIEEVLSVSGVGKLAEQIEVTNFDSPDGEKEFIAGLAEGQDVEIEANYVPNATHQNALIDDVENGRTVNFQVVYIGSSPDETFAFAGVCLGWQIVPSATEQNKIQFTVKITGSITVP